MAKMPVGVYEKTPEHRAKISAAKMGNQNGFHHGHNRRGQRTPTYTTWVNMLKRSSDQNYRGYKNYGGRGIRVCKRWLKFENFLKDMSKKPKGLTLDRINNDGNYELGNCRWATWREQARNKRNNKLTVDDVLVIRSSRGKVPQRELAQRFKVSQTTINFVQLRKLWKDV